MDFSLTHEFLNKNPPVDHGNLMECSWLLIGVELVLTHDSSLNSVIHHDEKPFIHPFTRIIPRVLSG